MLVIYKSAHGIQSGEFDLTSSPPIAQSAFYAALLVRDIHQWYISEVDFSDFSLGSHLKLGTSLNSPPAMARRTTSATTGPDVPAADTVLFQVSLHHDPAPLCPGHFHLVK